MKKVWVLGLSIFLLLTVNAQQKGEKAVANAVEQLRKAMVDADKMTLENLTMESLAYVHSGGHVDSKREFVDKIVSGQSDFVTLDLTDQVITVSGKVAVVRHNFSAKTNDNGKPGEVHLRIMLVWQKQKTGWKLLARQATKIA